MPHRTRIKICGLSREDHVDAAVAAGADAVGLVFYARSPRHVSLDRARALARRLPPFVTPVGLFVNAEAADIEAALDAMPGLLLQFHGDETADDCERFARPYLRAVRMRPGIDLAAVARAHPNARALLLDAHVEGYGGGGRTFDWALVPPGLTAPIVLSGGLDAGNVADGIRRLRPFAVDVSSGVEAAKGVKDPAAIERFCAAVRAADDQATSAAPTHASEDNRPPC